MATKLPQFVEKVQRGGFFDDDEGGKKLTSSNLLANFVLAKADTKISFDDLDNFDLKAIGDNDSSVEFTSVDNAQKQRINAIIRTQSHAGKFKSIVETLFNLIGENSYLPVDDNDVKNTLHELSI